MIPDDLVQTAIMTTLKSYPSIVSLLPSVAEIKEDQYQSPKFLYPGLRVDIIDQYPTGDAVGRTKLSHIVFGIIIISEKPSSQETNQLAGEIVARLFDSQIFGASRTNVPNYFKLIRVDFISSGKAIRYEDREWEKEITFESEAHFL